MLFHRIYYSLKPYVPWRLRMELRRSLARKKRRLSEATWPIDPSAGAKPAGWPGWPDGKKFALVLTHDVESKLGLEKTQALAQLEHERGYRSSFNFIPEGEYQVPDELRLWLRNHGFEVGVHDLHHDGWLYRNVAEFEANAGKINQYLRKWHGHGFRAGFMLRNLQWLQQLEVQYDASTFDTDPFEMQSDGAQTIFPFWVPLRPGPASETARRSGGYLELPYTLPQDSTLFLLLKERSAEIWKRKLDWIAEHGGMALVNVHPDYIQLPGEEPTPQTYPASLYLDLLDYARKKYGSQFWQPVAAEVARFSRRHFQPPITLSSPLPQPHEHAAPPSLAGKRVAVLLYSYYPSDPRPRRAAEALAESGATVDVICLRENMNQPVHQTIDGVNVHRLGIGKSRGGKLAYLWEYGRFITSCFTRLATRSLQFRYDLVHVHNMPDILVAAALPAKLRGAKVILDLHDPMPELMTSIYGLPEKHWMVSVLKVFERWSIRFSDLVLTPNIAFKTLFVSRACPENKIDIVMNSPQPEIFAPDRAVAGTGSRAAGRFRVMHHGSIVHRHGVDQLVEAVALAKKEIPEITLDIYGRRTPFLDTVLQRAEALGIKDSVCYHGPKNQREIAEAIIACDLGVVPNRHSLFTEVNFPTRLFEYLAMSRPVIAPSTQGIRDYFDGGEMYYFEPGNVEGLARQIVAVYHAPEEAPVRVERGRAVYRRHLWANEKRHLQQRVHTLLTGEARVVGEEEVAPQQRPA